MPPCTRWPERVRFGGLVDDGLDPHGPAVFEVLLDARVLEDHVHLDLGARREYAGAVEALGAVRALGVRPGGEHRGHLLRAADADVVGDQRLEETAGPARVVEDQCPRDFDLAHRQLPPVAGGPVSAGERGRDDRRPPAGERLHISRPQTITDGLQAGRVVAGSEPVGQLGEGDPGRGGLPLGPLVPVDPHLRRVREVAADLDEARAELAVVHVEVVRVNPPLLLDEVIAGHPGLRRAVTRPGHPLILLGNHDGGDPEAALPRGVVQVRADVVKLAVIPAGTVRFLQVQHRDAAGSGEVVHLAPEPVADLLKQRRRRDGIAQMPGQERHHLAGHLKNRAVSVQVEPVQALNLQADMSLQHLIDVHHARHATSVPREGRLVRPGALQTPTPHKGAAGRGARPPPTSAPLRKFLRGLTRSSRWSERLPS